jgi:hypothetical protein
MIASMRARSKPPPAALLDNLDGLRRNFRNPTQHPEKVYDIHEAQDLFCGVRRCRQPHDCLAGVDTALA